MNQRPNFSRMILLSSLTLLIGSILLAGCGGKSTADIAEFQELISMESETSIELIETAVSDGEINYETSLLYKMYAIFGDEKLPEQYRSPKKFRNANGVIKEVQSMMGTLSQATQDELAPFFRRPNDPESYINIRYREAMSRDQTVLISNISYQRPTNIVSESIDSENGLVRIWYPSVTTSVQPYSGRGKNIPVSAETVKKMAERLKKAIDDDDIMERFYDLLQRNIVKDGNRGGDDKLDIYVIPSGGDDGMTTCEDGPPPCSTFIQINTNLELSRNNILITTLAHEIFHSFQYAYKYHTVDDDWWSEATAVWSEDFIYPGLNTEHSWLDKFIPYPETELFSKTDPTHHEYGAYIFPYYLSESTSQDGFMRASWEGCETQGCLKAVDAIIDGGYKQQWREFTLWNYNKDPVKYYGDVDGFPDKSSADGFMPVALISGGDEFIEIDELKPLSAFLIEVKNQANNEEIKRLIFKDLHTFTGLNDNAAMKAVIYYKNGTKEVEDWTDRRERSFCIENPDEDFERIMLIFSNADMKESIPASEIGVDGKDSCYHIEQEDDRTAIFHLQYVDGGVPKVVLVDATIETNSYGAPEEKPEEGQQYAYLTQWKVLNHFESIKSAFSLECNGSSVLISSGWANRSAAYLVFDLGPEGLNEDGTFSIDLHYGLPHPKGNYEVAPDIDVRCINAFVGGTLIDLSGYSGVIEGAYTGRIYDMTEDGAKIEVENCCLLHSCALYTGEPFQDMSEPVILEIKK